ncbi:unannotated protein [freshwater metagenome]|uniref:Unannotated protein n=1 Tax=freshwater metagenome TaxID=449393 RepID=A0A6J7E8F7_9ZZZZ
MIGLDTPAKPLAIGLGTDWQDHEFLNIDIGVGVGSTVNNVHHRHGENMGVRSTEITEQGQVGRQCGSLRDRQRDTENRVRAEFRLVVGSVGLDERSVDRTLFARVESFDGFRENIDDGFDGLEYAFSAVSLHVPVAQFVCFERSS